MKTTSFIFVIFGALLMACDAIGIFELTQLYMTLPITEDANAQLIASLNFKIYLYISMFVVGMFMAFFGWESYKSKQHEDTRQ